MKTLKPKVIISAVVFVLGTASFSAMGQDYGLVPPPDNAIPPGAVPVIYPSEQGAYVIIESMQQALESYIAQNGCGTKVWSASVLTDSKGNGSGKLSSGFTATSAFVPGPAGSASLGRAYQVTGGGALNGISVANFVGNYVYTIGSQILSGSATWNVTSTVAPNRIDPFSGLVIKDFWRPNDLFAIPAGDYTGELVNSVIDWGYQSVSKKGYPVGKYWQASRTWRDDGVAAETHFLKTRVAVAPYTSTGCTIAVDFDTTNPNHFQNVAGVERFQQVGYVRIGGVDPGNFFKK